MAIRKEQGLFLVTLAFGAWMYTGIGEVKKARRVTAKAKSYELPPGLSPIIVDAEGPKNLRELFVEPKESRPLPPRTDLPFPKIDPLPVVLLPLPIGQHPPAYSGLRHAPLPPAAKNDAGESGTNGGAVKEEAGAAVETTQDDPARRFDCLVKGRQRFWGRFLGEETDKFRLASTRGPYMGETIRLQWIDPKTGKSVRQEPLTEKGEDVTQLEIAQTLRNEVGLKLYLFKPTSTNMPQQREMIRYLLDKAKLEPWVFDRAIEMARTYMRFAKPKEEGLLYLAKVLRAMGDLPAAYKLFRDLDDDPELKGSSFQLRGLGMIEARLGLDKLAEEHLTRAVEINRPIDPRNYFALATYLLDRGRAPEAVDPARKAVDFKGRRDTTEAEQMQFQQVLVRALLAVGDLQGAAAQAARAAGAALQIESDYQNACVAYAKQDLENAKELFQGCYNSGRMPDALVGVAACQVALGQFKAARVNLAKIVDDQPRLRHLGLAGLGLLRSSGQPEDAIEKLQAAVVTYPNHPYILYMLGRQRRLGGDLEGAVEPLKKALALHDDFLEALAELAVTYYALFQRNQDAEALISALRYIDRLVKLDQTRGGKLDLFLEMQGQIHYEARDLRGAKVAFSVGEATSKYCKIGLAIIEYAQKRFDLAEQRLNRMTSELQSDDPFRLHAEFLLQLMRRHSNKEQVVDRFDRRELGKNWKDSARNGFGPKIVDGKLVMRGKFAKTGLPVVARRTMKGPGRFIELQVDMRVGFNNQTEFAGVAVEIPGRGTAGTRFRIRVGMDPRGQLVIEVKDGRVALDPIRTGIEVTRDAWHTIVISVADADDADPKDSSRYLKIYYDGGQLYDQAKSKLKSLRRSDNKSTDFYTELRVEGKLGLQAEVDFRNYRRVQEKAR